MLPFLLAAFFFPSRPMGKVDTLNCDLQRNQHVRAWHFLPGSFPTRWLNRISSDDSPVVMQWPPCERQFSAFPIILLIGCRLRTPAPAACFSLFLSGQPAAADFLVLLDCSVTRGPKPPISFTFTFTWLDRDWMDLESLPGPFLTFCLHRALAIRSLSSQWILFFSVHTPQFSFTV